MMKSLCFLLILFLLSCSEAKKDLRPEKNTLTSTTSKPLEKKMNPVDIESRYGFSQIIYSRFTKLYMPEQRVSTDYTIPAYYKTEEKDFVNLGKIEQLNHELSEDDKYRYLDETEQKLRQRFSFHDGISWKIKSRSFIIFDTYSDASKSQFKIKMQEDPEYSN